MGSSLSRMHALIIASDKYKDTNYKQLKGCEADANAVKHYLTQNLLVPENQILCLINEQATRQGILEAFFSHLIQNSNIDHSDPILIYFAGK